MPARTRSLAAASRCGAAMADGVWRTIATWSDASITASSPSHAPRARKRGTCARTTAPDVIRASPPCCTWTYRSKDGGIFLMTDFEKTVLADLSELKAHMRYLVGSGNAGRI